MSNAKAFIALVVAVLTAAASAWSGNSHIDPAEAVQVVIAVATAINVWLTANGAGLPYAKTLVAAVLAGANALAAYLTDGITYTETINIVLAVLGALGVYAVSNGSSGPAVRSAR